MGIIRKNRNNLVGNLLNELLRQNWDPGDGLKFDNVDDYVILGDVLSLVNNRTFSAICTITENFNIGKSATIISRSLAESREYFFGVITEATVFYIQVQSNNSVSGYDTVYAGPIPYRAKPYHLAASQTGTRVKCYLDGVYLPVFSGSETFSTISSLPNHIAYVGKLLGTNPYRFKDIIFDLKVFNKGLTDNEILYLYNTQCQMIPPTAITNCVLDIRFEDKQGLTSKDISGNGYNGALTGFTGTTLGVTNAWVNKYGSSIQVL